MTTQAAPKLLILADDLSGAADCAVAGVRAGLRSVVMLRADVDQPAGQPTGADVLALDTDTRRANAVDAAARQVAAWHALARPATRLYKKIDSTLRGNVAAEVAALVPLAGLAIVAPAFPAAGRTTRIGCQHLNGVAVEDTEVWRNEGLTGRGDLWDMLVHQGLQTEVLTLADIRAGTTALAGRLAALQADGVRAVVCDAETDDDLARIADASVWLAHAFWVGSAGLAPALIRVLGLGSANAAVESAAVHAIAGPVLTVVGSMSSVSHAQVRELKAGAGANFLALELPVETLDTPQADIAQTVIDALCDGRDVLVTLSQTTRGNSTDAQHFCRRLAALLAPALPHAGGLIATGGETARAVLSTAGIDALQLTDEIEPGMPLLHAQLTGVGRVLPVVTKAGGFGAPGSLHAAWRRLIETAADTPPNKGTHAMTYRPVIGITMGDAAGVGPEIIMKALSHRAVYEQCRPLVIGDTARLLDAAQRTGVTLEVRSIERPADAAFRYGVVDCIDLGLIPADLPYGKLSPIAGDAAYQYIARTVELTSAGELDAICTAPLNKEALHAGGHIFPGHTEMLAHLTGIDEVSMMLVAPNLRVIHVTTHIGLLDAIRRIEPGLVQRTIERAHATLVRTGIDNPRIGVCGINPHAGENGLFGHGEEEEKIIPAVQVLQACGWRVEGPLPADTLFFRAGRGDFDVVVAMYHDQGHGPVKVMGLEAGVNVTVGLPVIRTSVDHGTAFDIAGKGIADERSMLEAFRQACELATRHDDPQAARAA
ncbi:4-hydroxythreonine-4-phosphate dehydrogenase PdxA [Ralstonia pseudosolanacearum]|uniref:4-hydroxythreonine-4-phosphate dehydrogenase PdxA n=1 Tax=Ralstonia pseudosolanacearum TaxID=1310165 RepID=UPI002002C79F|nr:4-hydroxythreonine-4-phosphate dehydrogenase PdxA [Ralstonia pseudosolanacearum]MCK4126954.1 4-hydroxythreonine-4-phosphate dehydrogenase PdxA [Ralstonia pseudosolanacearum]